MLRVQKLTDYGIVLMARLAIDPVGTVHATRELAAATRVPVPTAEKVLKLLARADLLASHRGAHGGYSLVSTPEEVTVAAMIEAIEGPLALTECSSPHGSRCEVEDLCAVREHWAPINLAVRAALDSVTLADLSRPVARDVAAEAATQSLS